MDTKITPAPSLSLFKETKIGNECVPGQIIIQLQLPSSANLRSLPNFNRNSRPQRHVLQKKPSCPGEEEFARSVLSCAGSIHFGTAGRYPRSIAWRTLQDKKVLELRSIDLSKNDGEKREATIVIQLAFSNAIWDGGVALADPEDQDFLNVFVLTKDSELYTLTINRDFFCHAIASEEEIVRWYKIFKPSSFSMSIPHRLIAVNSLQLAVSLGNGKLLILKRSLRDDGSIWHETTYGGGSWASNFGSFIRWQGGKTIKYDGCSLDLDTATALALSPDGKHVWAVCLNHTFKVWSLDTAVSVFSLDLLGQTREPHEMRKVALDPNILHTLQVFQTESKTGGDEYYVMTFSPVGLGQFKIWGIRDPNEASRGIRDMFPEYVLPPPDPDPSPESKAIWKVADFQVNSAEKGKGMEIWVLMRSNKQYRLYSLTFGLEDLANQWQDSWLQTTLEMPDRHIQPSILDLGPEDVTDLWLKFLLYPGRYPETVLETALSMYSSARKVDIPSKHNSSYVQRVCGAVTSHIRLQQNGADMDFQKYREDLNQEWSLLWQDVKDLNNSRWGVLSLGFDKTTDIAWITFADGHSVIRECSRIEVLAHNTPWDLAQSMNLLETPSVEVGGEPREPKLPDELAVLVEAAANFRQTFGDPLRQKFNLVVTSELWQEPSSSVLDRMQSFYDKFNFAEEIKDIEISALEAGLESIGGYNGLETSSFLAIIDELPQVMLAEVSGLVSTCFGLKVLVEGARQMVNLYERVLVDLLVMVVFISTEVDGDEYALKSFDGEKLYVIILEQLKRYQMMQWLARNIRSQTVAVMDDRSIAGQASDQLPSDANHNGPSTVLENLFAIDVKPQEHSLQSQSAALTHSMQDILKWVTGGNEPTITLDIVLVHVQCSLLVNRNLDLALDFLCFQPSTAWATYIKGRLYLLRGEYTEASFHFKRAAYKLSRPIPSFDYHHASHNLLSSLEAAHLQTGLASYYMHILNLFETCGSKSYSADFAHLALQFTPANEESQLISLFNSIFSSSLAISQFRQAYSALIQHPEPNTLLPSLIDAMICQNEIPQLFSLPFPPSRHPDIDAILSRKARSSPITLTRSSFSYCCYEVLSAWRLRHNNIQGAAAALLERLDRLSNSRLAVAGKHSGDILETYLVVINLLACAGDDWVLSSGDDGVGKMGKAEKRKVVTVADVRKRYQDELDRRSVIEGERFEFGYGDGGDEMDIF